VKNFRGSLGTFALLTLLAVALPAAHANSIAFTNSVLDFTIVTTGTYTFLVAGAQGGGSFMADGGLGALASGSLFLNAGTELQIAVGGQGFSGNFGSVYAGGGGGGTFVYIVGASNPLFAAGGGGGSGYYAVNGGDGQTGTSGAAGSGDGGGAGGSAGAGGTGGSDVGGSNGGGGGGWLGVGGDGLGDSPLAPFGAGLGGGGAFTFSGGLGDGGDGDAGQSANGGFGGGGGGGYEGGGGGGGYSGGGGGDGLDNAGGGGGSYIDSPVSDALVQGSMNAGDGYVTLTAEESATPEPATFVLFGVGVLCVASRRRRKQA
jgi:hypothetical protein